MEFIYLEEKKRMCQKERAMCSGCSGCALNPQNLTLEEVCYNCSNVEWVYPDMANEIVKKWANEHPRMTNAEYLFSILPSAKYIITDGFKHPKACAASLGFRDKCDSSECVDCWKEEYNVVS